MLTLFDISWSNSFVGCKNQSNFFDKFRKLSVKLNQNIKKHQINTNNISIVLQKHVTTLKNIF